MHGRSAAIDGPRGLPCCHFHRHLHRKNLQLLKLPVRQAVSRNHPGRVDPSDAVFARQDELSPRPSGNQTHHDPLKVTLIMIAPTIAEPTTAVAASDSPPTRRGRRLDP